MINGYNADTGWCSCNFRCCCLWDDICNFNLSVSFFFFASLLIPIMCVNLMKNIKSLYSEYSFTVCHSTIFPKIVYMINWIDVFFHGFFSRFFVVEKWLINCVGERKTMTVNWQICIIHGVCVIDRFRHKIFDKLLQFKVFT